MAPSTSPHSRTWTTQLVRTPDAGLNRVVWLLWLQGWESAPYVAQCVLRSWRAHNPGWQIVTLDRNNLYQFVSRSLLPAAWAPQAWSDVIRLSLLSSRGGVWADATMLCLEPLDSWVHQAVASEGSWMYHNGKLRAPASWFLVGTNQSLILWMWMQSVTDYAARYHTHVHAHGPLIHIHPTCTPYGRLCMIDYAARYRVPHTYFWLDSIFHRLLRGSPEFAAAWRRVPSIDASGVGSAHWLGKGRVLKPLEPRRACPLSSALPHAIKLDKRLPAPGHSSADANRSAISWLRNGHYAVYRALGSLDAAGGLSNDTTAIRLESSEMALGVYAAVSRVLSKCMHGTDSHRQVLEV